MAAYLLYHLSHRLYILWSKIEKFLTNYVPQATEQCLNNSRIENQKIYDKEGRVRKYLPKWESISTYDRHLLLSMGRSTIHVIKMKVANYVDDLSTSNANILLYLFPYTFTSLALLYILISMYANKFHPTMIISIIIVFLTKISCEIVEEILTIFTWMSSFQDRTYDNSKEIAIGEHIYSNLSID